MDQHHLFDSLDDSDAENYQFQLKRFEKKPLNVRLPLFKLTIHNVMSVKDDENENYEYAHLPNFVFLYQT